MATKTDLSKFKEQLTSLLEFIKELYSDDKDLDKIKIKVCLLLDSNPRAVANMFVENLTPFAKQILNDNDEYFLQMDYETDGENNFNQVINKLKSYWTNMNNDNKDKIKKYFKILLFLGCMTTKNEELRNILNLYREVPINF